MMSEETPNPLKGMGNGYDGKKYIRLPKVFREKLSKPMPSKAITQHPTKTYLSTIKAIYITERLNDVFGIGGWDFEHDVVGEFQHKDKPFVVVAGRLYLREFDLYTPIQYGGHELSDKGTDPSDGFKSAVTDAMGKCASLLEIGIQVFKGSPNDQTPNKAKRLDPDEKSATSTVAEPTSVLSDEPATQSNPEPVAPQPDPEPVEEQVEPVQEETPSDEDKHGRKLSTIEEYKKLYGKHPIWNMSQEKMEAAIEEALKGAEKAEEETKPDPTPVHDIEPSVGESPDTGMIEEAPLPSEEPVTEEEEEDAFDVYDDTSAERRMEGEDAADSMDAWDSAMNEVNSYIDAEELRDNAGAIVFNAQMDGMDDATVAELKKEINKIYKSLK